MSTVPTTTEHARALALAVRDGELTPEQRECLVDLLHSVAPAAALVSKAGQLCPDNDAAALGYLIATWAPVKVAYAELARDGPLQRRGARRVAWLGTPRRGTRPGVAPRGIGGGLGEGVVLGGR